MTLRQPAGPLVEAIIPCYNQGRFLAEAVDSVLGQSYPHVGVIVVDDGSTDDTSAVAARYGERIRYIRKENAGLSAARNTGLLEARGEWVLFLDSDDYLPRDMVAQHMAAASAAPAGTLFYGGWQYADVAGQALGPVERKELGSDAFHALLVHSYFPCHSAIIRRTAFANVGLFDVSLRSCEDWDMWIRFAAVGYQFVAVPDAFAVYRRYAGSMSTASEKMWLSSRAVYQKSATYHHGCARCRTAIVRGTAGWRRWCFDLLVEELWVMKAREGLRASVAHALGRVRRDPSLAVSLFSEVFRYLRKRHNHSRPEFAAKKPQVL
jgi:glycosyltransferase involved in cell wall biosynthesis